jgi:hypothetical protein
VTSKLYLPKVRKRESFVSYFDRCAQKLSKEGFAPATIILLAKTEWRRTNYERRKHTSV